MLQIGYRYLLVLIMLSAGSAFAQKVNLNTDKLIKKLTIEEKERIVIGSEMEIPWSEGGATGVGEVGGDVPGAAGKSLKNDRLGLPIVILADGPAGVRINPLRPGQPNKTFYATAFPVATMLASSFNTELMDEVGQAFGHEAKEYGVDILLAPALNIHRNPLGGRNFEYYSEDPLLSGKMASAFTQGVQSYGVGVSIKHFAANNQETNRARVNALVTERALREIYLRGFEIAIKESKPWTVMSAYNKVNNEYASQSKELLITILRDEWGFDGFVMTDWFAGESIVKQLQARNDLIMPGIPAHKGMIQKAIENGEMTEEELNQNVRAILNIYQKTPAFLGYQPTGSPDLGNSKSIALRAAEKGMVLLKNNEQTLPLKSDAEVALFGLASYETIAGGTGSGNVNKAYSISIIEGLENEGVAVSKELEKVYRAYVQAEKDKRPPKTWSFGPDEILPEKVWTKEALDSIAGKSSIGIFTLNRTSGEFYDRKQGYDYYLSKEESDLIKRLSEAYHAQSKKFVVILNIGGVIETASWKDQTDAILLMWQAGQEGGNAVAKVLKGAVNPSGKLPMTFPVQYMDHYSSKNFPGRELEDNPYPSPFNAVKSEVIYEEGIYVGYRYFDSFDVPVSFPFGFGLSYTDFEFSDLETSMSEDGTLQVSCKITNTGKEAGKEVVQLYIGSPQTSLDKPDHELRAFVKSKLLAPDESLEISFTLTAKDYASFDTDQTAWVLNSGVYTISVGNAINQLPLTREVKLEKEVLVLETTQSMLPGREIDVLQQK
ncbi:MAG: glycosyl hydrolase [Flammeovirgaceae bacterium]|nr:glycosyl hydrolase [Flammeovirgaceae bacterium]MBR07350.1 glycosyl hydrolase [Rickettsiales bacterium]